MTESRGHVLLVDDQPANLEVLARLLGDEGYRVRAVTSGERAIEAARLLAPECILLDVAMPDMDGIETCAALSALPELQTVPVIFITAFDDAEHKVRAFAAGGRDFVTKPFQAPEVLARVDTHVRLHRMDRELRQQNVRLVTANAQLEQMSDMRARISAMLVHDIRSPLTVIGAALDEPGDAEAAEDARTAYGKILRLIQELLELYRRDYEASELRRRTINVTELVRGAVNAARGQARKIGVSLELAEASVPEGVRGDSERLDRVLANLLENALKFTPRGGTVTVSTATEPGVGVEAGLRFAVIAVIDTGPGIPAEDLPYVFDPYRQRDDAKAKGGGVGLGLSIVQRLVAAHGGRVRVFSRVGVGTEFRVLLPIETPA